MPKMQTVVRRQVRDLLAASPAYAQLKPESQRRIAEDMAKVADYLAAPEGIPANQLGGAIAILPVGEVAGDFLNAVNFPAFVAGLIHGVFHAVVDASIQQMKAYGELLGKAAASVDAFTRDAVTDDSAREWLLARYADCFDASLRMTCRSGVAKRRLRLLTGVDGDVLAAARRRMAADRQQLLATMVMMG